MIPIFSNTYTHSRIRESKKVEYSVCDILYCSVLYCMHVYSKYVQVQVYFSPIISPLAASHLGLHCTPLPSTDFCNFCSPLPFRLPPFPSHLIDSKGNRKCTKEK